MNDLISRKAAIEALNKYIDYNDDGEQEINTDCVFHALEELPSAQTEPKWIPVTERLPSDRDWVLGVFKEKDTGWINPIPFVCDYLGTKTPITTDDFWILKEHVDEQEFGFDYYRSLRCVAWMPLPEPYKEKDDAEIH